MLLFISPFGEVGLKLRWVVQSHAITLSLKGEKRLNYVMFWGIFSASEVNDGKEASGDH
jgi:hypothetical protein